VDGVAAAATAIPLIATATAIPLIATNILALTIDGTLAITPIVGPTMDMQAIRFVDRPTSLLRANNVRLVDG
jgi:hypothetical protein